MKLDSAEADQFLTLMLKLQWYVNQREGIWPEIESFTDFCAIDLEEKVTVRDHLFAHAELIDQFVQENPENLSAEELGIISAWKHYVQGEFYIERYLKKGSIFIGDDDTVYSVLGLHNAPDDFIHKGNLPIRVQAILLPFKGKVVYDGFLRPYNVFFGSGISSELKQIYLIAKDNKAIVQTLPAPKVTLLPATAKSLQDWAPLLEDLSAKAKKLRGGGGQPGTYSPAFSLVRTSIELAQLVIESELDERKISKKAQRIDTLLSQFENALMREMY